MINDSILNKQYIKSMYFFYLKKRDLNEIDKIDK